MYHIGFIYTVNLDNVRYSHKKKLSVKISHWKKAKKIICYLLKQITIWSNVKLNSSSLLGKWLYWGFRD